MQVCAVKRKPRQILHDPGDGLWIERRVYVIPLIADDLPNANHELGDGCLTPRRHRAGIAIRMEDRREHAQDRRLTRVVRREHDLQLMALAKHERSIRATLETGDPVLNDIAFWRLAPRRGHSDGGMPRKSLLQDRGFVG